VSDRYDEHDDDRGDNAPVNPRNADVTGEVGSEGGTPGDVELEIDRGAGAGSEAGETWQPAAPRSRTVVRDGHGAGRRSS
jgi:hypothetical protein